MIRILAAALGAVFLCLPAFGQTPAGCQYNTSGLGLAAGQTGTLQCDAAGNLKTTSSVPITGATPVSSQVTCTTAGTVAALAADATKAVRTLSNQSGSTVYLGPTGVQSTTGLPVPSGSGYDASSLTGALYCATASGTAVVGVLQY
jgi:hypothetical protein